MRRISRVLLHAVDQTVLDRRIGGPKYSTFINIALACEWRTEQGPWLRTQLFGLHGLDSMPQSSLLSLARPYSTPHSGGYSQTMQPVEAPSLALY